MKKSGAQRNTTRRQPYAWLGAGAVAVGVGVALAGAGTAHADDGVNDTASAEAASSTRAPGNAAAGAAPTSAPRSPAATSRPAGPRQTENDGAGKRALTTANRPALATTPRVRPAVPVSATASASVGKPSAAERAAQAGVPAPPVQNPPIASVTATVQSEAGDRPLRRTVARAVAAPAPVAALATARAAVNPAEALNAAVVDWFDSTSAWLATLPRGPLNELASGALLLVRRNLFDQQPTADPYQFATRATGQLVGTLSVVDPEGAALSYSLSKVPEFGTVQIAQDGIWIYTPGPDFAYGVPESFSVTVNDGGFNILDPTAAPLELTVPVGLVSYVDQFSIQNSTTRPVGYTKLSREAYRQPPKGYQIQPGEQVQINISTSSTFLGTIQDSVGLSTGTDTWKINYKYQGGWTSACGESGGNAGCVVVKYTDRALIGDSAGTYTYQPDSPEAVDALAKLSQMADKNVEGLTVQWLKANFKDIPADDQGWVVKSSSADNPSDNTNSRSYAVTDSTSTTEGSSWKVGAGIKFSPIEKVLELAVNAEYNKNYSSTTTKSFQTTFSQSIPP